MCDPFFGDCPPEPVEEQPTEEPVMEDDMKMDGDMKDDKEMPEWEEKADPLMGNISYLLVALGMAAGSALQLFRYRSNAAYYDSTNW